MTSQKEQIQSFIAEIDSVLQKTNPRLPWVMSGEVLQQRQMLERVRNFFVDLLHQLPPDAGIRSDYSASLTDPSSPTEEQADVTPYQMMQTILRDVSYLRANMAPPPQTNQQQLTSELLQVLMSRLQENLSQQIAQTLENLRNEPPTAGGNPMLATGSGNPPALARSQYDQLQSLRSRSDQMLVNLDSTLNIVFGSLQRNIEAYQESLKQGVEQMYSLGQQSEVMFKALIDQLAQQLKQEASSYLLSSAQPPAVLPETPPTQVDQASKKAAFTNPITQPGTPSQSTANPNFPYAGAELSSRSSQPNPQASNQERQDAPLESAIETWLQSVRSMNQPITTVAEASDAELSDIELPNLDLSDLELIDLDQVESDLVNETALDKTKSFDDSNVTSTLDTVEETRHEANPFQIDQATFSQSSNSEVEEADHEDAEDTSDIDAALKLLEELTAELDNSAAAASLEDAEAQLEQMLSSVSVGESPAIAQGSEVSAMSEDARDELDDFYQSLFGEMEGEAQVEPTLEAKVEPPEEVNIKFEPLEIEAVADITPDKESASAVGAQVAPDITAELPSSLLELESDLSGSIFPEITSTQDVLETDLGIFDILGQGSEAEESEASTPIILDLPDDLFEDIASSEAETTNAELETVIEIPEQNEVESLTDLFETVKDEETRSVPIEPPAIDLPSAIAASQPATVAESFFLGDDLFGTQPSIDLGEDQYTRAAPEENLLPDAPVEAVDLKLDLDDLTLTSLNEDLSSLEGLPPSARADLTLDDFAETLDDFAEDIVQRAQPSEASASEPFTLETTSNPVQDLESQEVFSLDAFAEAIADPPPSAPATGTPFYQASAAIDNITVEGFGDLFEDTPPVPNHSVPPAIASTESLPFTLESTNYLLETNLSGATSPPPATSSPFTLEGMDDLFDDAAPVSPSGPQAPYNPHTQSAPVKPAFSQPSKTPDSLESIDELFGEAPLQEAQSSTSRTSEPATPEKEASFTLESTELFGDVPALSSTSNDSFPSKAQELPSNSSPLPFTLEGMDDLFEDVPPIPSTARPASPPPREIPPFKPELFNNGGETVDNLPPFQLERLDSLFIDVPATSVEPSSSSPTNTQPPLSDKQTLDDAFESFFGPSEENSTPTEKKKKLT